jgi:hypothetical protein
VNEVKRMPVSEADVARTRRLHAMGVQPFRLRGAATDAPIRELAADNGAPAQPTRSIVIQAPCVLVLPHGCDRRQLDLVGRAMHAFGPDFARAPRVVTDAGGIADTPPVASAYVVFGELQAHALGHVLPADVMRQAEVVLLATPDRLSEGTAKRQLWLALKALRRRLRGA